VFCAAAQIIFDALGGAHPRYSSLLAQRRVTRRNGPRRLAPCCRKRFPALLALSGARELVGFAHSDMHALLPETAAMLGGVNGMGGGNSWLRGAPSPLVQPSAAGQNRSARGLSERSKIASSAAPVFTEEHRGVGAKRRPSRGGAFLLPSFLWASKEKKGWRAEPSAFKTGLCATAHIKHQPARQREQSTFR